MDFINPKLLKRKDKICRPAHAAPCRAEQPDHGGKPTHKGLSTGSQGIQGFCGQKKCARAGGPAGPDSGVVAGRITWRTALFLGGGRLDPPYGGRKLVLFRPSLRCGSGISPQRALCRCPRNTAEGRGLSTIFIASRGGRLGLGAVGALGICPQYPGLRSELERGLAAPREQGGVRSRIPRPVPGRQLPAHGPKGGEKPAKPGGPSREKERGEEKTGAWGEISMASPEFRGKGLSPKVPL